MPKLAIRKPKPSDAYFINDHWKDATPEDLLRLGELGKPDPNGNIEFMQWLCTTDGAPIQAREDMRIWTADDNLVGYSTLKNFTAGGEGQIHLHLARPFWRKGYGAVLFCLSAEDFIKTYNLQPLYCQPKADNPMPNGMLQKVGFPLLGSVDFQRQDGSVISQNRYWIDPMVIEKFLGGRPG